jgi:ribonuclease HII
MTTFVNNDSTATLQSEPIYMLKRSKSKTSKKEPLQLCYDEKYPFEIGIDEAGRGPMFGRLYVAGVILPKDGSVDFTKVRDSKKISAKKRKEMSDYIKTHALSYHIHYAEASEIDKINIREAVLKGMKQCALTNIENIQKQNEDGEPIGLDKFFVMVDGNDFPPLMVYDDNTSTLNSVSHDTFVGGDNTYTTIAAASILAKVARDEYITDLCEKNPLFKTLYGLDKNMGYGTKQHMEAIETYGITTEHRRTYGICKTAPSFMGL